MEMTIKLSEISFDKVICVWYYSTWNEVEVNSSHPVEIDLTGVYSKLGWPKCLSWIFLYSTFLILGGVIISKGKHRINEDIFAQKVRIVGNNDNDAEILTIKQALFLAEQEGLDLVEVAPQASPPVCKLMDYGKFLFEQAKKAKEAKKHQKVVELKEVRMRPKIEEHDFNVKVKNANKFLLQGDKVKVSVGFRGREFNHTKMGKDILDRFAEAIAENGDLDNSPRMEGKFMAMTISPKK